MGYWDATQLYLQKHGGPPTCPDCGKKMFVEDDHGRFHCICGRRLDVATGMEPPRMSLPEQVDATSMTDEEKAKIPPINRLCSPPTAAEQACINSLISGGPGSPAYVKAEKDLREERGGEEDPP